MSTAHFIESDDELQQLHLHRQGFIYNDYAGDIPSGATGNVLHLAECRHIGKSNTKYPKVFFEDINDAAKWISNQRGPEGTRWRRCACCRSWHAGAAAISDDASADTQQRARPPGNVRPAKSHGRRRSDQHVQTPPFTEGQVEELLQPWLEADGYSVRKQVRVGNGIIDMVARKQDDEWVIEAKGEDRGGFGTAEMNFRIGIAQICSRMDRTPGRRFALAIPLTAHFRRLLLKHRDFSVFERMEIWMIVATSGGTVTALAPNRVQQFVNGLADA